MVLHGRNQNLVSFFEKSRHPRGNYIDTVCCSGGEDDLVSLANPKVILKGLTRLLKGIGRQLRKVVYPAVNVRVVARVIIYYSVDNRLRCLRGGRVIEVQQRLPIDLF